MMGLCAVHREKERALFGLEHGVGHPCCLCARQSTSIPKEQGVRGHRRHAEWPQVADTVIEARCFAGEKAQYSGREGPSMAVEFLRDAMERLVTVVQELSLARDVATVLAIVCHAAHVLTGADGASFVLREGERVRGTRRPRAPASCIGFHGLRAVPRAGPGKRRCHRAMAFLQC